MFRGALFSAATAASAASMLLSNTSGFANRLVALFPLTPQLSAAASWARRAVWRWSAPTDQRPSRKPSREGAVMRANQDRSMYVLFRDVEGLLCDQTQGK